MTAQGTTAVSTEFDHASAEPQSTCLDVEQTDQLGNLAVGDSQPEVVSNRVLGLDGMGAMENCRRGRLEGGNILVSTQSGSLQLDKERVVVKTAMLSDRARCNVGNPLLTQQHSLPVSSPWGLVAPVTNVKHVQKWLRCWTLSFACSHDSQPGSLERRRTCSVPGKGIVLFFSQVRHVCDGKSIRVRSVVSTSSCPAHSTACSRCTLQVSAVHVSVFVQGCIHYTPPGQHICKQDFARTRGQNRCPAKYLRIMLMSPTCCTVG